MNKKITPDVLDKFERIHGKYNPRRFPWHQTEMNKLLKKDNRRNKTKNKKNQKRYINRCGRGGGLK